jgi:sporulation protein YlmC with PRC-barrel domain
LCKEGEIKNDTMETLLKDNESGENHEGKHANTPLLHLTASSIIGDKVYNRIGEKLGEIKDIMINIEVGKIDYFVLEYGGLLGIGEKYFAIPPLLLEVDEQKKIFVLDQSREVLERAPGFDKDHWPQTNSHELQETYTYWAGHMGSKPLN